MRNFATVALLFGSLTMASGCIITTDDDDEGGRFSLGWVLSAGSSEITCTSAGAGGVETTATDVYSGQGIADIFTCEDGAGTTALLPLSDYTVVVSILEQGTDAALGTSLPRDASLDFDGDIVDLGDFDFAFSAVEFSVDYGGDDGRTNCDVLPDGEGVAWQRLTLTTETGSECLSYELLVDGLSDLDDLCNSDAQCVERASLQTIVGIEAGSYVLTIEGIDDGDVACFWTDEVFTVTDEIDLGTIFVPLDTSVCS